MKLLGLAMTSALALTNVGCSGSESAATNQAGEDATPPAAAVSDQVPPTARADLRDAAGESKGSATATQDGSAIRVRLDASDMRQGIYAAHVHTTGACDPPRFESAGSHWNPTAKQHGKDNPAGMHKGDLDNLAIAADGRGSIEFTIQDAALSGGETALLDADGAAVMIHAKADDYRTDPTGNAGDRIACGVLR